MADSNITPRKDFVAARISKIDEAQVQGRISNDTLAANIKWKADDPERLKRDRSKSGNRTSQERKTVASKAPEPKKSSEPVKLSFSNSMPPPPRKTAPAGVITIDRRNQMLDQSLGIDDASEESSAYRTRLSTLENTELRNKLSQERQAFQRKIGAYQEGQTRQAQLVQQLQKKVLQYKRKCSELEQDVSELSVTNDRNRSTLQDDVARLSSKLEQAENRLRSSENKNAGDLDELVERYENEQRKNATLHEVNLELRQQTESNQIEMGQLKEQMRILKKRELDLDEKAQTSELKLKSERENRSQFYSNEHNKLRALWKSVLLIKKDFGELSTATSTDITALRTSVTKERRTLHQACSALNSQLRREKANQAPTDHVHKLTSERDNLENQLKRKASEMADMQSEYENDKAILISKNERANAELLNIKSDPNSSGRFPNSMQDSGCFAEAIEEIARRVVDEKDLYIGVDDLPSKVSRRSRSPSPMRSRPASPDRKSNLKPELATNTIAAVEQALKKRATQISNLKDQLDSAETKNADLQLQYQEVEMNLKDTSSRLEKTKQDRDDYQSKAAEFNRQIAHLKNQLETIKSEQNAVMRSKDNLNQQLARQEKHIENLRKQDEEQREKLMVLEGERDEARDNTTSLKHEGERLQQANEHLDVKSEAHRNEISKLREDLNNSELDLGVLKADKNNLETALAKRDCDNAEMEVELQKVKNSENSLNEQIGLLENELSKVESDKRRMAENIGSLEKILEVTEGDKSQLSYGLDEMKSELLKKEAETIDLANQKHGLGASLEITERTKAALDDELTAATRERNELADALAIATRKIDQLQESLANAKDEIDRQCEALLKLAKEKEELTKIKSELLATQAAADREIRIMQQNISALKADKDQLETNLHDAQQSVTNLEKKRQHLEQINSNLGIKNEALQAEILRQRREFDVEVIKLEKKLDEGDQRLLQQESEAERALRNLGRQHEEDVERLTRERNEIRNSGVQEVVELSSKHKSDTNRLITKYEDQVSDLQHEIDGLIDDHNAALVEAENDKQEQLNDKEKKIASINEKLAGKQLDLQEKLNQIEKLRRDCSNLQEAMDKQTAELNNEIMDAKQALELASDKHSAESKALSSTIQEITDCRDKLAKEIDEVQLQKRLLDEAKENQRQELQGTIRKLRDVNQQLDSTHREVLDLKRELNTEQIEKETANRNLAEMRVLTTKLEDHKQQLERERDELIKKGNTLQDTKDSLIRESDQLRATMRDVEKSRTELRKEVADVRGQWKESEAENERVNVQLSETKARLSNTEEREDDQRRENGALRHQLTDADTEIHGKEKENQILARRINELEDEGILMQRDFSTQRAEMGDREQKLKDDVRSLVARTDQQSEEVHILRTELGASETQAGVFQAQLLRSEEKMDISEATLNGYASALRRTLGVGKTESGAEVDLPSNPSVDLVRASLQQFVLELQNTKSARDDAKLNVNQLEKKLDDLSNEKEHTQSRLEQIQKALGDTEQGKRGSEAKLANAQTALLLQEETIRRTERERRDLVDRLGEAQRGMKQQERVHRDIVGDLESSHNAEARLDEERKRLKDLLDQGEARATKLEIERRGLDGDLHRAKVMLADKDGELSLLSERIEQLNGKMLETEQLNHEQRVIIDKAEISSQRAKAQSDNLKERVTTLNLCLSEKEGKLGSDGQRICHLEKLLTASEHDRQLLEERLGHVRLSSEDLKKKQATLSERLTNKNRHNEDLDLKQQELEGVIKHLTADLENKKQVEDQLRGRVSKLTDERKSLAERVTGLQRAVTQLASEKQNEHKDFKRSAKENMKLKKAMDDLEKGKGSTEEVLNKISVERAELEHQLLVNKQELKDASDTIKKMEIQLISAESIFERRLADQNDRFRRDMEIELERVRVGSMQNDRCLDAKDRAQQARISVLEENCQDLREQANRANRQTRRKQRQTADLLQDIRRSSPERKPISPTRY